MADKPGDAWVVDILHMLPSDEGHIGVLVAVDVFSRFCILVPMKSIDSDTATQLFERHVLGFSGVPEWSLTDGGSEFQGEWPLILSEYNIGHKLSAPGHSQSHGMVERLIATTEITIAHFIDKDLTSWHRLLGKVMLAHNSEPHPALSLTSTHGLTPAEVFLGRKLVTQLDRSLEADFTKEKIDLPRYIEELKLRQPEIRAFAQASQRRYHERMEKTAAPTLHATSCLLSATTQKEASSLLRIWSRLHEANSILDEF